MFCWFRAEYVKSGKSQDGRKRCVDWPCKSLTDAVPDDSVKRLFLSVSSGQIQIFSDSVKYDNRIVYWETQNDKEGGDEKSVNLITVIMSENGEDSCRHKHIVQKRRNRHKTVFPRRDRLRNFSESESYKNHDAEYYD